MFIKNERKNEMTFIEKSPGSLPAQIILNNIIEKNYKVWMIGNIFGNTLFFQNMSNDKRVIVGFTEKDLAISYVNRKDSLRLMLKVFGKKIVVIQMHLVKLNTIVNSNTHINNGVLDTIIINPNSSDFFLPINFNILSQRLENSSEMIEAFEDYDEHAVISYDRDYKKYFEIDELESKFSS